MNRAQTSSYSDFIVVRVHPLTREIDTGGDVSMYTHVSITHLQTYTSQLCPLREATLRQQWV